MKKLISLALLVFAFAAPAFAAPPPPPAPKLVVLDRVAILQFSKVGRDIARQLQSLGTQNKASFDAQQRALAAEGQTLRQQVAILAPDARQKREDAFNEKVRTTEESAQRKQTQIQAAAQAAQAAVAQALSPIVQDIVKERGANLVIDKASVIFANSNAFDITPDAIARLDAKLPSYKVTLGGAAPAAAKKK